MRRVAHAHLDRPGLRQRVVDRPPVHASRFHRHIGHAGLCEPASHLQQRPPERFEALDGHLPFPGFRAWQPDRDPDHLLVHVDPGDPRMDDIHRHLLQHPPMGKGRHPRSPQQDQDPVTRARSSNPGYLPGGLQRPSTGQAHSTKAQRRQRAAPQVSPIRGRHDSDMGSIGRTDQTRLVLSAAVLFLAAAPRIFPLAGHESESHDAQSEEAINHVEVTSHQLYSMCPCALDYNRRHQALRKHEEWRGKCC